MTRFLVGYRAVGAIVRAIWEVVKLMGLSAGILSLVLLTRLALNVDVVAPLEAIANYYQKTVDALFGWTIGPLEQCALLIQRWLRVDVEFGSHWRHIFIIMWLYFSADLRANWGLGRTSFALFSVSWGALVALVTSLGVGIVDPGIASNDLYLLLLPYVGLVIFELGRTIWSTAFYVASPSFDPTGKSRGQVFRYCFVTFVLPVTIVGASTVFFIPPALDKHAIVESIGLTSLFGFIIALSVYWLGRGAWLGVFAKAETETCLQRFFRSGSTRLSFAVFATLIGALLYFALNAGLQIIGL